MCNSFLLKPNSLDDIFEERVSGFGACQSFDASLKCFLLFFVSYSFLTELGVGQESLRMFEQTPAMIDAIIGW